MIFNVSKTSHELNNILSIYSTRVRFKRCLYLIIYNKKQSLKWDIYAQTVILGQELEILQNALIAGKKQ